ncbi:MAG: hypothetical protein N3I86_05610 [Verrucomicrobiae bacterium]|nr:hypothetical protein [Verrucomicrobiae bacterium]
MNTWKVILATLVIFAAGVVTGGLLVNYVERDRPKAPRPTLRPGALRPAETRPAVGVRPDEPARPPGPAGYIPRGLRLDLLERLQREVRLTPEQRERIEKILTEGQEKNRQLWERIQPEIRREIQQTHDRIRAVLNPEQREKFEELMKQRAPRKGDEPFTPRRGPREGTDRPANRPNAPPPSDN